ncbi:MAG: CinA family protein [Bacteroidota bacterium]|nr:CinA family protein [Bacteroidota bacterium]
MENKIVDFLMQSNKTISFAESCTGGSLSKKIVLIPGASDVFQGSIVSYSNNSKINILNINTEDLKKHSVVSEKISKEMAINAMKLFKSDYSISTTGNAGPTSSDNISNIGDCFISIASKKAVVCKKINIDCDRESFISKITEESLKFFINTIIKN